MIERASARGRVLSFCGFRRTVSDLQRSIEFYVQALGFAVDGTANAVVARLTLGDESIELFAPMHTPAVGAADRAVSSSAFQHLAIVASDMSAAMQRLARHAPIIPISSGDAGVQLPARSGGVTAFKFRDPDGHALELIGFPRGSGNPKWQRADARGPTLGIDHSAIGVASVERSLAFYVGLLGFRETAKQTNHGDAQARLDGIESPEVDVVSLSPAAAETPHVELLCYRAPLPRLRIDVPPIGEDLGDRIVLQVDDLLAVAAKLTAARQQYLRVGEQALLVRHEQSHPILLNQACAALGLVRLD